MFLKLAIKGLGLFVLFMLIQQHTASGITYTSTKAGNWIDVTVWSPAGVPGGSDDVIIAHAVITTDNITITSSGSVTVNASGLLDLFGVLTVNSGGSFTNNGGTRIDGNVSNSGTIINNDSLFIDNNGIIENESGGVFTSNGFAKIDGNVIDNGGTMNGNGNYIVGGNVELNSSSSSISGSSYWCIAGNFAVNDTSVTVNNDDFVSVGGNFENSGTVTGSGSFNVTENVVNTGTVSLMTWCVGDNIDNTGVGVIVSDCTDPVFTKVTDTCNSGFGASSSSLGAAGPLPIVLLFFKGSVMDDEIVLTWATASEIINEYFTIEKSTNGIDFKQIAQIAGAGTTTERTDYSFTDNDLHFKHL